MSTPSTDLPVVLPPAVVSCDYCRRELEDGDAYYRLEVSMDEVPNFVGDGPGEGSLVESSSEAITCQKCEPEVSKAMDALLLRLWQLRRPDGTEGNPEAFSDAPTPSDQEPDTERLPCLSTAKTS